LRLYVRQLCLKPKEVSTVRVYISSVSSILSSGLILYIILFSFEECITVGVITVMCIESSNHAFKVSRVEIECIFLRC
jgi:hypothetical protein